MHTAIGVFYIPYVNTNPDKSCDSASAVRNTAWSLNFEESLSYAGNIITLYPHEFAWKKMKTGRAAASLSILKSYKSESILVTIIY